MGEMEKRLLLFFGVTFVLVSLWPRIFPSPPPPEPRELPGAVEGVRDGASESTASAPDVSAPLPETRNTEAPAAAANDTAAAAQDKTAEVAAASERTVMVETSMYEMKLTNRGARLRSFMLQEYRDDEGRPYEILGQNA